MDTKIKDLRQDGPATLREVEDIHRQWLAVLEEDWQVLRLDCTGVTEADLGFLQLLLAFSRSAERGARRVLVDGLPPFLVDAVATSGLADHPLFANEGTGAQ